MKKKELQDRILLLMKYDLEKTSGENITEQLTSSQKYIPAEKSTTEVSKPKVLPPTVGNYEKLPHQNPSSNIEQSENIKTWMKNNSSFTTEEKKDTSNVFYFNFLQTLQKISDKLLAQDEEVVVPILNQLFNKYRFKFEESGVLDNITITAPNKSKKEFEIDFWTSEDTHNALMAVAIIGSVAAPFLGPTMAIAAASVSAAASLADAAVYQFVDDDPWMAGFSLLFTLIPFDELYRLLGGKYSIDALKRFSKKVLNKKFAKLTKEEIEIINQLKNEKDKLSKAVSIWFLKKMLRYELKSFFKNAKLGNMVRFIYLFSKTYPKIYGLTRFGIELGGVYYTWSALASAMGIEKKEKPVEDFDPEMLLEEDITDQIAEQLIKVISESSTIEERDSILLDWGEKHIYGKNINDNQLSENIKNKKIISEAWSPLTVQKMISKVFKSNTVEEVIGKIMMFLKAESKQDRKIQQLFNELRAGTKKIGELPPEDFSYLISKMDPRGLTNVLWHNNLLFSQNVKNTFLNRIVNEIIDNPKSTKKIMTELFNDRKTLWGQLDVADESLSGIADEMFSQARIELRQRLEKGFPDTFKKPEVNNVFQLSFEQLKTISPKTIDDIIKRSESYLRPNFVKTYISFFTRLIRKWKPINVTTDQCSQLAKSYLEDMAQGNTKSASETLYLLQKSMDNLASQYKGYLEEFMLFLEQSIAQKIGEKEKQILIDLKDKITTSKTVGEKWETLLKWDKKVREEAIKKFGIKVYDKAYDEAWNSFRFLTKSIISVVKATFSKKTYIKLSQEEKNRIKSISDVNSDEYPIWNIIKNKLISGSRRGLPTKDNPLYSSLIEIGGQRLAILSYSYEVIMSLIYLKMEIAFYETLIELIAFRSKFENADNTFKKWWNLQGSSYIPKTEEIDVGTFVENAGLQFLKNLVYEAIQLFKEDKSNTGKIMGIFSLFTPQPEEYLFRLMELAGFFTISPEKAEEEVRKRLKQAEDKVKEVKQTGEIERDSTPQPPKLQPTQSKQDSTKQNPPIKGLFD